MPYRGPIDASTRYCAVYGHPIRHSASPAMQNAGIEALGLNWRYLAFEVRPEKLREAIEGAKHMNFVGLNLTVPHKLLAMDLLDCLDDSAKAWGAVNTIRFETVRNEIVSKGFNTDADAIIQALHEDLGIDVSGATVLLLGAGGAGRVAALRLASEGVKELYLVNRTASKAEAVANEIRQRFTATRVVVGYSKTTVDLVINATSLGLKSDDPLPFAEDEFSLKNVKAVYDMVYRPAETPLLKAARAAGCRCANGIGMLLHQGAKALELWSGQKAPISVMRDALLKNIYG